MGTKERLEENGRSIQFLKEKVLGQKVFIKYDTVKYDEKNDLLCYLYLSNKTFLNTH